MPLQEIYLYQGFRELVLDARGLALSVGAASRREAMPQALRCATLASQGLKEKSKI